MLLALILLGCTRTTTTVVVPPTPLPGIPVGTLDMTSLAAAGTPDATALAAATSLAASTPVAATTADTPAPGQTPGAPTPTSFAEGLTARLGTPNPAPNCADHNTPWFFNNLAQECAGAPLNTWASFEPFEHGAMVFIAEGGHTYVLLDDGSLFKPYQEVIDPDPHALPAPDPSLVPPAGLFQPTLGFGKFWRGLVPGTDWVRQRLGWATAPEVGYSALWQCNTASGDADRCYFTGPRDQVVALTRGSAPYWAYWQGPVR
jgi:hypothetical protein